VIHEKKLKDPYIVHVQRRMEGRRRGGIYSGWVVRANSREKMEGRREKGGIYKPC
jgi:hypothetical protein